MSGVCIDPKGTGDRIASYTMKNRVKQLTLRKKWIRWQRGHGYKTGVNISVKLYLTNLKTAGLVK